MPKNPSSVKSWLGYNLTDFDDAILSHQTRAIYSQHLGHAARFGRAWVDSSLETYFCASSFPLRAIQSSKHPISAASRKSGEMYADCSPSYAVLDRALPPVPLGTRVPMNTSISSAPIDSRAREYAELLRAMANGDRNALGRLYDLLAKPLYSLAYRVLHDSAESQDVVHDVFLQLWKKAGAYEVNKGAVFSWAATLTRNRSIDRLRMRQRRAEILHESADDIQPETSGSAASYRIALD